MIKIQIHAESEGVEGVQTYEGDDPKAALTFVEGLQNVKDLQCSLLSKSETGETRALARRAKGQDSVGLVNDIKAWLNEHDPEYPGNAPAAPPSEERETVTITPQDVATVSAEDLVGK